MRRTIALVTLVITSSVASLGAQAPPQKPGPEHKKLEYFLGKWTTTGDMKASPMGPGGKITSKDNCEWFQGGFAVVCHSEGTGPTGPTKAIAILAYNPEEKKYTYYGLDNTAMSMGTIPKGTVEGSTWTYTDSGTMGGQPYQSRFVINTVSPTSYTFRLEMLGPDKKWMPILEGMSTKAK
jgi:hypothetical protein